MKPVGVMMDVKSNHELDRAGIRIRWRQSRWVGRPTLVFFWTRLSPSFYPRMELVSPRSAACAPGPWSQKASCTLSLYVRTHRYGIVITTCHLPKAYKHVCRWLLLFLPLHFTARRPARSGRNRYRCEVYTLLVPRLVLRKFFSLTICKPIKIRPTTCIPGAILV
jgi:hypothetical protein